MAIDVFALLGENPILLVFTIIGLGYLVAKIRIAGVPAGPVIGVLLVGLLFGHLGFSAPPGASSFGFAFFIFSVGIQAGPAFFSAFAADGLRYVTLACVVAITAVALSLVLARLVGLEYGFSAGMLAAPSPARRPSPAPRMPSGAAWRPCRKRCPQAKALENIGVGYAITYVFGTLGMILVVRLLPRIAGIDLPAEAAKLARERGFGRGRRRGPGGSLPIVRAYRLPADMVGKTVAQVDAETGHLQARCSGSSAVPSFWTVHRIGCSKRATWSPSSLASTCTRARGERTPKRSWIRIC